MSALAELQAAVLRHWGFSSLRPLQAEAAQAVLERRDSLVVLPTGGGKSLCYQAPAVMSPGTTVVVSPLIALMKDQVDALKANGIAAAPLNSALAAGERNQVERELRAGSISLLFVSPERLVMPSFVELLQRTGVSTFAIDEAHCISQWGHDFRADYRQLGRLKEWFPKASVHGYTATATEPVRRDIVDQLRLRDPLVLVGRFDRPNLTYRVESRGNLVEQVCEVIDRHSGEAGIIYCIRRRDVDEITQILKAKGHAPLPYHAGLAPDERHTAQDAFAQEKCNLIVATVAFGMGIDRSNIRFIIHTGIPKSIEYYQQETGRAGRDGLEAECVLLHSGQDIVTWKFIVEKGATEAEAAPEYLANALRHLDEMARYCQPVVCRHRALSRYFGQEYEPDSCQACDVCLEDREPVPDGQVVAQKILSCVARVNERFGIKHVVEVLRGGETEAIERNGHQRLSTYGLLRDHAAKEVGDWVQQLLAQGLLERSPGEYPVLTLNDGSWAVMRGERQARLVESGRGRKAKRSKAEVDSWEGVDRQLFESLRELRRGLAEARQVFPFVIFSDAVLRNIARVRPSSLEKLTSVSGIGEVKRKEFGAAVFELIDRVCRERRLSRDNIEGPAKLDAKPKGIKAALTQARASELFRNGASIEQAMAKLERARSTVQGYLLEHVKTERPVSIDPWVPRAVYERVAAAVRTVEGERLMPIFEALSGEVPYEQIRLVIAHRNNEAGRAG